MGTNYYARVNACDKCGLSKEEIHIGKSSWGWKFKIEIQEEFYNDYPSFIKFIQSSVIRIFDEYNREKTFEDLLETMKIHLDDKSHFEDYPEDKYTDCEEADLIKGEFS